MSQIVCRNRKAPCRRRAATPPPARASCHLRRRILDEEGGQADVIDLSADTDSED